MQKSTFSILKMDCSSEEQMIRMKLDDLKEIQGLEFDIQNRKLTVYHTGDHIDILNRLDSLNFDTKLIDSIVSMIIISLLALIGNVTCLCLLQKSKSKEAHMQASMIFTSNDVIVNIGVIMAGILVYLTSSNYPDLVIGIIVFGVVGRGALRILNLSKANQ